MKNTISDRKRSHGKAACALVLLCEVTALKRGNTARCWDQNSKNLWWRSQWIAEGQRFGNRLAHQKKEEKTAQGDEGIFRYRQTIKYKNEDQGSQLESQNRHG